MVQSQSEPVFSGKVSSDNGRTPELLSASDHPAHHAETLLLTSLKDLVTSGEHRLDPMLAAIADGARRLTGASGAALAMWRDGDMVCRARSGETAPSLGAKLSAETGISGECLRTGRVQHCLDTETSPLVDAEVCRSLGIRSIAVLPIQGWRGVNGILEVFSTVPGAFSDRHLVILDQLAALAERARATQPHGASPVSAQAPPEKPKPTGLLPASDRVGDVAMAFLEGRTRPWFLGAIGLAAILLIGFVVWLGWRGPGDESKAHAAAPQIAAAAVRPSAGAIPDNDPVWKPNPGGEPLFPIGGKTSAGTPVKLASKVDVIPDKRISGDRALLSGDATNVAFPHASGERDATSLSSSRSSHTDEPIAVEAPVITASQSDSSALNGVLMAKATVPGLSAPVSQGVSGGQLLRRVSPQYPAQARSQRLQGRVLLSATVMKDGTVRNVKAVQGPIALAQPAMEAVKQWRYQPFVLDGKLIERETTITIDFKLP